MEIETESVKPQEYTPHLKAEAKHVWELYQSGTIRELYFRADRSTAVLMLECLDVSEAQQILTSLPLVQAGLITFEGDSPRPLSRVCAAVWKLAIFIHRRLL